MDFMSHLETTECAKLYFFLTKTRLCIKTSQKELKRQSCEEEEEEERNRVNVITYMRENSWLT